MPLEADKEKDAPMATPSARLWTASPMTIIQATGATLSEKNSMSE